MAKQIEEFTWRTAALLLPVALILVLAVWFALDMAILAPRRLAKQAEAWSEVPCSIRKIEVETVKISNSGKGRMGGGKPGYAPRVEFDYEWQGVSYTSHRLWFGTRLWNEKADAEAVLAPYRGENLTVCFVERKESASQMDATRNRLSNR